MHSHIQDVIDQLAKRYKISNPFYLSDVFVKDGTKKLYEFLQALYRDEYANDYRIVIVQDCVDRYQYQDLPGSALIALQQSLRVLDISNFFVTIISANPNIEKELDQVRQLYSTDQCCINYEKLHGVEYQIKIDTQDTFCPLPWMHLYIGPDGNVLPCCVADQQFPMGNVNENSIESIMKSPKFDKLRQNMLSGIKSKECHRCYLQEDSGLQSSRKTHNLNWSLDRSTINKDGTIDKFEPVYLDIRLSNICNLKCRMCSSYFSSAIAQEEYQMFGKTPSADMVLQRDQKDLTLNEIMQYLPTAEKIYFAGGEPLLAAEHYKILQGLIDCNNTDIEIQYSTNLSSLQYKNLSVIDLWKKFSNLKVLASIDAQGAVAEYARHGCNWNTIESNLQKVKQQCPHVQLIVSSTVSLLTIESLIELQQRWHTNRVLDITKFLLSVLMAPEHLSVCALPAHHKTRIENLIRKHIDWCCQQGASSLADRWKNIIDHMQSKDLSYSLTEFRRLTLSMDQYRGESFVSVLPDYKDLLE